MQPISPLTALFVHDGSSLIPAPIAPLFWTFHKVHQLWRYKLDYQRVNESSSDTFLYFAGFTAQKIGMDTGLTGLPIKWLAQLALVIDTAARIRSQCARVEFVYIRMIETLTFSNLEIYAAMEVTSIRDKRWRHYTLLVLDSATNAQLEEQLLLLTLSVQEVARLSLQLIIELFTLSNLTLMFLESLSWSDSNQAYAVQMFFLNWKSVLSELSENGALLREQLTSLSPLIKECLGVDVSVLISACSTPLAFSESFTQASNFIMSYRVVQVFGRIFSDAGDIALGRHNNPGHPIYQRRYCPQPRFGEIKCSNIPPPPNLWAINDAAPERSFEVLPLVVT